MMTENSGDRLLEPVDRTIDCDRFLAKMTSQISRGCMATNVLAAEEAGRTGHVI